MNPKTVATVRGINDLGSEVSAWEVRLQTLQSECQSLQRLKEKTQQEIDSSIALAKQDLGKKQTEFREEEKRINELKAKLTADQAEFQGILSAFKKEKSEFVSEKQGVLDSKEQTEKLKEKLNNFALFIRRESEKI